MLLLATTEREYPWGTLRSTNASKVKVVLEEKGLVYRRNWCTTRSSRIFERRSKIILSAD